MFWIACVRILNFRFCKSFVLCVRTYLTSGKQPGFNASQTKCHWTIAHVKKFQLSLGGWWEGGQCFLKSWTKYTWELVLVLNSTCISKVSVNLNYEFRMNLLIYVHVTVYNEWSQLFSTYINFHLYQTSTDKSYSCHNHPHCHSFQRSVEWNMKSCYWCVQNVAESQHRSSIVEQI